MRERNHFIGVEALVDEAVQRLDLLEVLVVDRRSFRRVNSNEVGAAEVFHQGFADAFSNLGVQLGDLF